jgi:hypothetical protein
MADNWYEFVCYGCHESIEVRRRGRELAGLGLCGRCAGLGKPKVGVMVPVFIVLSFDCERCGGAVRRKRRAMQRTRGASPLEPDQRFRLLVCRACQHSLPAASLTTIPRCRACAAVLEGAPWSPYCSVHCTPRGTSVSTGLQAPAVRDGIDKDAEKYCRACGRTLPRNAPYCSRSCRTGRTPKTLITTKRERRARKMARTEVERVWGEDLTK